MGAHLEPTIETLSAAKCPRGQELGVDVLLLSAPPLKGPEQGRTICVEGEGVGVWEVWFLNAILCHLPTAGLRKHTGHKVKLKRKSEYICLMNRLNPFI